MPASAHPLRTLWRALRVLETVATGAAILLVAAPLARPGRRPAWLPRTVRWWHGRLARALGLELRTAGTLVPGCLLVCNHISWLDVAVLGAQGPVAFLSKSEVRDWPLAGWMAARAGTLFIARGGHQVGALAVEIAGRIAQGETIVVFPEGTTSRGVGVRRFHPRLFAVAEQPGLKVQPAALRLRRRGESVPDTSVAFVDDQSLIANLWQVLRHPGLVAELHLLPPGERGNGDDRRALAARTRSAIVAALELPESAGLDAPSRPRRERAPAIAPALLD